MIWLREIQTSLINHIKSQMVNLKDHYGNPVDVRITIRNPQVDIEDEKFPAITIYNTGYEQKEAFTDVNSYDIEYLDNGKVLKKPKAPKFLFTFQIDFWSRTRTIMDSLMYTWTINNPKYSILSVLDSEGKYTEECNFTLETPQILDYKGNNSEYIYRIAIPCNLLVTVDNEVSFTTENIKAEDIILIKK